MTGFATHLFLFLALAVPIVIMGAFYAEAEDRPAWRSVPRRYVVFVGACGVLALIMLLVESLFASVR